MGFGGILSNHHFRENKGVRNHFPRFNDVDYGTINGISVAAIVSGDKFDFMYRS
jgi:hypothetical protein